MKTEPCYFYIEDKRIWPLCQECGKNKKGAMFWNKEYGIWELKCHNPECQKLIWKGKTNQ